MSVANTLDYNKMATVVAVKRFIVQALDVYATAHFSGYLKI